MSDGYLRIRYELVADREDELVADLWSLGCLGTETIDRPDGGIAVEAWFAAGTENFRFEPAREVARATSREWVPHKDWMADYRDKVRPLLVGRRLVIDPREPGREESVPDGRQVVRVPAREAFGTGSHASTRLALEMLEDVDPEGSRVLDVGAGSGVLSFAAELFGARFVVGVELDLVAALLAAQNRVLNDLATSFVAGSLEALESTAAGAGGRGFDLALVNVLPYRVRRHLPRLVDLLAPGATMVFSGIPEEEGPDLVEELADLGLLLEASRSEGEWVAFRLVNRPAAVHQKAVAG